MQRAIGIGKPDQRRGFGGGLGQVFAPRPGPLRGEHRDGIVVHPGAQQRLQGVDHRAGR